ncbi:Exocyst complex component [Entamoeba marina]
MNTLTGFMPKKVDPKLSVEQLSERNAIARISEYFSGDDSTQKINEIELQILDKSESLDARLKTCMQEKLEGFTISLNLLETSKENAEQINELALKITDVCQSCDELFQNYGLVKQITTIKRNLKEVIDTVKYLKSLKDKVKEIEELLKDEQNLLKVHIIVRTYEMLRLAIEKQIRTNNLQNSAEVDPYFQLITQIRQMLTVAIEDIMESFISFANKSPEILVKIAIISERDRKDKELLRQQSMAENLKIQQYEYDGVDHKETIQNLVRNAAIESIRKKFVVVAYDPLTETQTTIGNLQTVLEEITTVAFDGAPCFPSDYSILEVYLKATVEELHKLFGDWSVNKNITNSSIIGLFKFVNDEYIPTLNRIGIEQNTLPDLIKPLRPAEIQYRERIKGQMYEWVTNIANVDISQQPNNIGGLLYTTAPVDLFSVVKEQIEIARSSKSSHFIFEVVNSLLTPMELYKSRVVSQLKAASLYAQLTEEQKADVPDSSLPLGYVIAMINNANSCIEKTEDLLDSISELIDESYIENLDLSPIITSFDTLIDEVVEFLVHTVLVDCEETIQTLFDDEYYEGNDLMEMIVGCIDEYASNDFGPNLLKIYVTKIVELISEELVIKYVTQLVVKKHKFNRKDEENTGEMIMHDFETMSDVLGNYFDKIKLDKKLNVLRGFASLLSEDENGAQSGYQIILQDYRDCKLDIIKFIINERDDLSGSQKDTVMKGCANILEELGIEPELEKPTIFSKLQLPSKLSGFGL